MFTKEDIAISDFIISELKSIKINLDNQINHLYILTAEVIDELKVTSLSKILIIDFSSSPNTNGRTSYSLGNSSMSSQIEIDKKVFINFNNRDIDLKNKALETIYHELYHVYNEENLFYKFGKVKIPIEEVPYCKIGTKCWAEYLSYYKIKEFHMSDYPFKEFNLIYNIIQQRKANPEVINRFLYMISNICAYESNKQYIKKLEDTTYFTYIRKDGRYNNFIDQLKNIMQCYPDRVSGVEVFTNLGKTCCELIKHFHYEIRFKNGNMIVKLI